MGTRVPCDPAPTPGAPFAPSATTATVVATTTAIIRAGIRRGPATTARGTGHPFPSTSQGSGRIYGRVIGPGKSAAPELALLPGVTETRQPEVEPLRPEAIEEA